MDDKGVGTANIRLQAAMEYLMSYGWALIVITIVVAIFYVYVSTPTKITPDTCSFESGIICTDINIGTYPSSGATILTIYISNQGEFGLYYPRLSVTTAGRNITDGYCYPSYLPAGGVALCQINLTTKTTLNQFISGAIRITANNCGLVPNYIVTNNCTGAPSETLAGSFSGHTETPVALFAYVSDNVYNDIYVVDLINNTVVNTITGVANSPSAVAASPFFGSIYVASSGGGTANAITVINTTSWQITNVIELQEGVVGIALNSYGGYVYATSPIGNVIYTINTTTNGVVNTISLPNEPDGVSLSPDNNYAYIALKKGSKVMVMSTKNYSYTSFSTGTMTPYWTAISSSNLEGFVVGSSKLESSFTLPGNTITNTLSVGSDPFYVTVSPNGYLEFVSDEGTTTVSIVNTTTDTITTVTVGSGPVGTYTTLFSNFTYVGVTGGIKVINTGTFTVVNTISLPSGASPYGIAVSFR